MERKRPRDEDEDDDDEELDRKVARSGEGGKTSEAITAAISEFESYKKEKKVRSEEEKQSGRKKILRDKSAAAVKTDAEEGPVMEGLVEVAAEARGIQRQKRREAEHNMRLSEDTSMELGDNVQDAEEKFHVDVDDDGQKLEPFNLEDERKNGYFDAEGTYIEYKEEKHAGDAWLEGVKVDESLAKKTLEEASLPEPETLTGVDIAKIKREIASFLEDGENVLRALKRLGGKDKKVAACNKRMQSAVDDCGMPGYTFDSTSGYYYSASAGLYHDPSTGGFYNGSTAKCPVHDLHGKVPRLDQAKTSMCSTLSVAALWRQPIMAVGGGGWCEATALYEVPTEPVRASSDGMDMFADSDDEDAAAAPKTAAPATDRAQKPATAPAQPSAAVAAPSPAAVSEEVHYELWAIDMPPRSCGHGAGPPRAVAFDRLTELSSNLMASGEYEVYSETRRQFECAAGAYFDHLQSPVRYSYDSSEGQFKEWATAG
eukprot:gene4078-5054_t